MKTPKGITEQRLFPRAKASLQVSTVSLPKNRLTLLDLSEGGMCFESTKAINSQSITIELSTLNQNVKLTANTIPVWEQTLSDNATRYGVQFIDTDYNARTLLRTESIKAHIEELIVDIQDDDVRQNVSDFFLNDLANYMEKVTALAFEVSYLASHSRAWQNKLEHLNTTILLKGYSLSLLLSDKSIMIRVKEIFRLLTGTWAYRSKVMKRAFEKPRAYPGDFRMMEMIYQNSPHSKGIGEYFDRYFLNNPDAIAVRSRKGRLREMIHKFIADNAGKESLRVLNVKCGSCREIMELIGEIELQKPLSLTCMDWDEEALDFSEKHLQNVPSNAKVSFLNENLIDAINGKKNIPKLGEYHLIYNVALTDYLPDKLLRKCLGLYSLHMPIGGQLILTHKNPEKTFPPLTAEWFCDWESIPRSKDELTNLFKQTLPGFALDIKTDDFGYIFYFTLTKTENSKAVTCEEVECNDKNKSYFKTKKNIFVK